MATIPRALYAYIEKKLHEQPYEAVAGAAMQLIERREEALCIKSPGSEPSGGHSGGVSNRVQDGVLRVIAAEESLDCANRWALVLTRLGEIFDGKQPKLPTGTDAMYALAAAMTAYARNHRDETDRIANSIQYADRMPPDFSAMLLKDYMYIEPGYRERLMRIPEFSRWLSTKGRLLNGTV